MFTNRKSKKMDSTAGPSRPKEPGPATTLMEQIEQGIIVFETVDHDPLASGDSSDEKTLKYNFNPHDYAADPSKEFEIKMELDSEEDSLSVESFQISDNEEMEFKVDEDDFNTSHDSKGKNGDSFKEEDDDEDEDEEGVGQNTINCMNWQESGTLKNIIFHQKSQLRVPVPGVKPIDYFLLIADEEFLAQIVEETNKHATTLFLSEGVREKSRITRWKDITLHELKVYLGLLLHMGTIQILKLHDYWRKDDLFSLPVFARFMSKNRFLIITRCFQYGQEDVNLFPDRFAKVTPIIDHFNKRMATIYYPKKELFVTDSQLKDYRARFATNLGLQVLTEANGVIQKCMLWTNEFKDEQAFNIVFNLMCDYLDKGHSLYMDKYGSYYLSKALLDRCTHSTGKLSSKKNIPQTIWKAQLKRGESVSRYASDLAVTKWRDHADTDQYFISSEYIGNVSSMHPIYASNAENNDRLYAYYPCDKYGMSWHKKVGVHTLQMVLLNSFHLYNKFSDKRMEFHNFRLYVIRSLLSGAGMSGASIPKELGGPRSHYPSKYRKNDIGKQLRKRCKYCSFKKTRKATPYFCAFCKDTPGLCLEPCFELYHDRMKTSVDLV